MYLVFKYFPLTTETINKITNRNETIVKVEESAIEDAVEKSYDAVVVVETYKGEQQIASGTGFVYKEDENNGYIMTNNHVIDEGNTIYVTFSNGEKVTAKLLGSDTYADIAVLSVPRSKIIKVIEIGSTDEIKLGSTVFAIGAPEGADYSGTVTKGIVSGKNRLVSISLSGGTSDDWLMKVIQTDAAINPGNSGGPLLNLAGKVVGITSLKLVNEQIEGIGFAIPIEDAMQYVSKLEKGETIPRPVLGVQLVDLNDTYALYYSNITISSSIKEGAVVQSVINNSAASKAGLKKGDIILEVAGKKITNKAELRYELYKHDIGDTIKIKYYRDNKDKEVNVKLTGAEE